MCFSLTHMLYKILLLYILFLLTLIYYINFFYSRKLTSQIIYILYILKTFFLDSVYIYDSYVKYIYLSRVEKFSQFPPLFFSTTVLVLVPRTRACMTHLLSLNHYSILPSYHYLLFEARAYVSLYLLDSIDLNMINPCFQF